MDGEYEIVSFRRRTRDVDDINIDEDELHLNSDDDAITPPSGDFVPHDQVALSHPRTRKEFEPTMANVAVLDYNFDVGGFKSHRNWQNKQTNDQDSALEVDLAFGPGGRDYWGGLLALTDLDMHVPGNRSLSLDMDMSNIIHSQFTLKIVNPNPGDTILYNAGVSWIRFPSNDTSFNFGVYKRGPPSQPSFKDILLPQPTNANVNPKVFVALGGFDVIGEWRIATSATNVSWRGFRLNIEAGPEPKASAENSDATTYLNTVKAIWIATTRPNVFVGEFEGNINGWEGYVRFPPHQFQNTPALFTGISGFKIDPTSSSRISVHVTTVPFTTGFTWAIKTGAAASKIQVQSPKIQVQYMAVF